jgi:hypothetical protein
VLVAIESVENERIASVIVDTREDQPGSEEDGEK